MREYPCSYVVARFVPNLLRDEARNIGVVCQCIDRGFIGAKFESNLRKRIGSVGDDLDSRVLRTYVEELEGSVKNFQGRSLGLPGMAQPLHPDFLRQLWLAYSGKIQFTEPRGCVSEDPAEELNELFHLLVEEEIPQRVRAEKRSNFAKEFGRQLRMARLVGKMKVKSNYPVLVKGEQVPVDFGCKHPRQEREVLIETVDLSSESLPERIEALSPTAVKFEIIREVKGQEVNTVSVVKTRANGNGRAYALEFRELKHHSDRFFDLSEKGRTREIIEMIQRDLRATRGRSFWS